MKKNKFVKKKNIFSINFFTMLFIALILVVSCNDENIEDEFLENSEKLENAKKLENEVQQRTSVTIINPGFEAGKEAWGDEDNYQISGVEFSGSRSGKISDNSDRIEQDINVTTQTAYELSVWVEGEGTVSIGGESVNFDANDYEQVFIEFNSGQSTSVTILGTTDDEARFDDFALMSLGADDSDPDTDTKVNLALGKDTEQSSTGFSGVSSRAVDGNTSGVYRNGSVKFYPTLVASFVRRRI